MKFLPLFTRRRKEVLPEAELLRLYRQSGELRYLGQLFQPCMEPLFAICYKYLRDEEDAKDAVMQLFEKLSVELRLHDVQHFKSWLHRVARNHCLMQLRAARQVFIEQDSLTEAPPDADESVSLDLQVAALNGCLQTLSPAQKQCIQLFFTEEKCYRKIAELTGYELNKVKSYIQNGKRNLKICMSKNGKT